MKHLIFSFSFIFVCTLFLSGCDLAQPQNKGQAAAPVEAPNPVEAPPAPPQENVPTEGETVMVRAETGVGVRGQSLTPVTANRGMDIIVAPISSMFRTQQRLVFIQVDDAMNKFQAMHDRYPASHEEYMEKVIRDNNIRLPQLPTNQEYFYDAAARELKVKKPSNAP